MKSSKMTTNYILILIATIVLISGSASALSEDFSAFASTDTINACACDLTTDHISVHNTGDVTSTFMLTAEGSKAAEWTELAPQTFYLEQGEVKQVERFIKVPCSARGEYTLNTTVRTLFDTEKTIEQTLNIKNCPNVQIIPKFSGAQEECPCTPVQYSFEVINTGQHVEMYEISVEPYSDGISLSTDFLVLEPGQKEEIAVFINLPCGEYGEKIFTFNALARGTGILGQTDFKLDIKKCYDYNLLIGTEYAICQGVPNIIPFQIDNKAEIANEYFIETYGAEWAYPENQTISAWGGETKESNILVFPPNEEENIYELAVSTLSARGEEERFTEILVETEKCYDYQLIDTEGVFEAVECTPKDHKFILKNIGSREATYHIDLEGLEWLTTTTQPIVLGAGEEVELVISGDTPCESAGEYTENIYVTINEIDQTYVEEKTFTIHPKAEAYLPNIEIEDLKITYEGGDMPVKITNTGFETVTYDLRLAASDWITIDTQSMTLAPGENATAVLQAYPTNETLPDIYAGEFIAKVRGEEIEYVTEFYIDLKESRGLPLWAWMAMGGGAAILIIIIIILALVLGKKPEKEKKTEIKEDKKPKKEDITIDKREYRKEKEQEKQVKLWPILLFIVIAALIAGGLYWGFTTGPLSGEKNETYTNQTIETGAIDDDLDLTTPTPEETDDGVLTNADIQESLITIDRSGVEGSGNRLEINNQTEINLPLSVKNPTDRKAIFTVHTPDNSWVRFERDKISVMPESTETTNVKITPDLEALEENDYAITINTTLEGKKIYYEEKLDLIISKKKPIQSYWPWLLAGLVGLASAILIISLARRKKEDKPEKKTVAKKKKKAKEKPKKAGKKIKKDDGSKGWMPPVIGMIILLILAALGFWAYNTFQPEDVTEEAGEGIEEQKTQEPATERHTPAPETKLTEADVEESLITIDRSGVPGEGDVLKLEEEEYDLPLSISNPTDRKARFTVNTSNESWIVFDQYMILVGPNSDKTVNMHLIPDMDALKKNNYGITINTKLEGTKIDYEEELSFVLKDANRFEASWWMYALAGMIIIGLVILIAELVIKGKDKKGSTSTAGVKGKNKKSKKQTKTKDKKEKDIAQLNKEISSLRKDTMLKLNR